MKTFRTFLTESNKYIIYTISVDYGEYVGAAKNEKDAEKVFSERSPNDKIRGVSDTGFTTDHAGYIGGSGE